MKKDKALFSRNAMQLTGSDTVSEDGSTQFAFFLGAGASIKAGVPDTFTFVKAFVESLNSPKKEYVVRVISILDIWAIKQNPVKKVDIELLLEALQRIADKDNDILLPFFNMRQPQLPKNIDAGVLLNELRDFIKSRVIVDLEAIKYLEPLRGFIDEIRPLDVYSANYDTCIEVFCSENKLDYSDGFDEAWNPTVFDNTDKDVRLFKVHGSVTWYRSDRGRFLKIPVMLRDNSVELITKERAVGLMLYPAQKFEYVEPLFELLMQMKQRLEKCKTLIVVGYSFRDDHIRKILWDVARKNKYFHMILISPSGWDIYKNRLRTYEDGATLSSLVGKVTCLPYYFEKVLPALRIEILPSIAYSVKSINQQASAELSGNTVNWPSCLRATSISGDIDKLRTVLNKVELSSESERNVAEEFLTGAVFGMFHISPVTDLEMFNYFWAKFKESIYFIEDQTQFDVDSKNSNIGFQYSHSKSSIAYAYVTFQNLHKELKKRLNWIANNDQHSTLILTMLTKLIDLLNLWQKGVVSYNAYTEIRIFNGGITAESVLANEKKSINDIIAKYEAVFSSASKMGLSEVV